MTSWMKLVSCALATFLSGGVAADQIDPAPPENYRRVGERIHLGGEPHSEANLAYLAEQGIKTVIGVDGATPNVEAAKKFGLRYIHNPIGYDGVPDHAGRAIVRAVRELVGPIFIHCHHGIHRAPAAAAIASVAAGEIDAAEAIQILERAGTSKDYAGLWRSVASFVPPPPGAELPELVEVTRVSPLAAAMAMLDRANDNVKRCREAGWATPLNHPDLVLEREAKLVFEGMRESARNVPKDADEEMRAWLRDAERLAAAFEFAVRAADFETASSRFNELSQSCTQCHARYRN